VCRDDEVAELDALAVAHALHVRHGREARGIAEPGLRIIGMRTARFQCDGAFGARHGASAAVAHQRRDAAGVVVVGVRVADQVHVLDAEPERPDMGLDQRRRLRQRAVEQDRALEPTISTEESPCTPTNYVLPKMRKGACSAFQPAHSRTRSARPVRSAGRCGTGEAGARQRAKAAARRISGLLGSARARAARKYVPELRAGCGRFVAKRRQALRRSRYNLPSA
jgi:hypothetical protein